MRRSKKKSMLLKTKSRKLRINDKEYKLTKTQYKLLAYLSNGENHLKENIINDIWGYNNFWADRNLITHVFLLNRRVKEKIVVSKYHGKYMLNLPMYVIGE